MRSRPVLVGSLALVFCLLTGAAIAAAAGGRVELTNAFRTYDSRVAGSGARVTSAHIGSGVSTVWAFSPTGTGSAVVHPCAEPAPADEATFRLTDPDRIQYATFATAEDVCLTSTVPIHVIVDRRGTVSATPEADRGQYIALDRPQTVWDAPTLEDGAVLRIERPAELSATATAAVLSLEVLTSDAPGYLQAWGCGNPRPDMADVSYNRERAANVAYVAVDPGDDLCLFAFRPAHVRVRLLGELGTDGPNPALLPPSWRYVPGEVPAPSLRSIVPERVLDTRIAVGRTGTSKVGVDEVVELAFGDLIGPLTTAVVLNVTAVAPEGPGHVTAWPCGGDRPTVSNLNFVAGETVPNLAVVKLGPGGTVCLSGTARHHLVADLNGTFETDGGLLAQPIDPERILDTRKAIGVPTTTKLPAGETLELPVTGDTVPDGAGAVTVNVTVDAPEDAGHLTVWPCDQPRPTASNLNFVAGQAIPNLVTAKLSADGRLCFHSVATTHVIVDIGAWYGVDRPTGLVDLDPERFLDTRKAIGVTGTSKVPAGSFIVVPIAGRGDVPVGADAVVVNVTVTLPEAAGFVTAWPCDRSMPIVSNLNYVAGETNPNLATVKLAANGTLCLFTTATAHLVADVSGYLTAETVDGDEHVLE